MRAPSETPTSDLCIVSPPDVVNPTPLHKRTWRVVPGLVTGVACAAGDHLEIGVSAEVLQAGGSVWLRALVDGKPAEPSDVLFKSSAAKFDGARAFTFVKPGVTEGQHIVEIEARMDSEASVAKRTLSVFSCKPAPGAAVLKTVAAVSGPSVVNASESYQDAPGLVINVTTTAQTGFAITFSAEAAVNDGRLMVRALIDGAPVGKEIIFAEADQTWEGARSFVFAAPTVSPGDHDVRIQWKVNAGRAWLRDRTMSVSAQDLSVQHQIGRMIDDSVALQSDTWREAISSSFTVDEPITNVAIHFSAELACDEGNIHVRALLNGEPVPPEDVTLVQGGISWAAHACLFVKKNLAPGRYAARIELSASAQDNARFRRSAIRVLWKRRSGSDWVQPFKGTNPTFKTYRMLVIGCDPMRPDHARPTFVQVKSVFEGVSLDPAIDPDDVLPPIAHAAVSQAAGAGPSGDVGIDDVTHPTTDISPRRGKGPNLTDWLAENSGGRARIGEVRYVGCADGAWYAPPVEHQGNYYWDNLAWNEMYQDALRAADVDVDWHAYDADGDSKITNNEVIVVCIRPQQSPTGYVRGTTVTLDGADPPMKVRLIDLYVSPFSYRHLLTVGIAAHELSHILLERGFESYGVCPDINPGYYSILDMVGRATHLDPHSKIKLGWVQPLAVNLDTLTSSDAFDLPPVETHHKVMLLHDSARLEHEYFVIENRFPGTDQSRNYDAGLNVGSIAVWQVFEDLDLVSTAAVCRNDPRFIRLRGALKTQGQSMELVWGDGAPTGWRIIADAPRGLHGQFRLVKIQPVLPEVSRPTIAER